MTTAATLYATNPLTPVGSEKIAADPQSGPTGGLRAQDIADLPNAITALSIASGVVNIDLAGGRRKNFTLELTANVTSVTISNLPASGFVGEYELLITQDVTGSRTFALPASHKALGGSDTAVASSANAATLLSAKTFNAGTTWRYAMQESA